MATAIFGSTLALADLCGLMPGFDLLRQRVGWQVEALRDDYFPEMSGHTDIIEKIEHPRRVLHWTHDALELEGGQSVKLPGLTEIPVVSEVLTAATHRGIEIDPLTGRVYGLLDIWHWCGNDPIRKHVARVDVARLMQFVEASNVWENYLRGCDQVGEWGWDVGAYDRFNEWLEVEKGRAK